MIAVNWWNPKSSFFFGLNPYKPQPIRNYITYKLTGQKNQDKETLKLAHAEIRKQKLQNDTIKGVHFYFEDKAKYWSLVKAFDICLEENITGVLPFQNDIWIANLSQPKEGTTYICGMPDLSGDEYLTAAKLEAQRSKEITFILNSLQQYWPMLPVFLLLLISALPQKRNFIG